MIRNVSLSREGQPAPPQRVLWNRRHLLLGAIIMVALFLRLGYSLYVHQTGTWLANVDDYSSLAYYLATEGRYVSNEFDSPSIMREPGFPILLAVSYSLLWPGFVATIVLLCLFNLATIILVWKIAMENLGEYTAWLCAGLAAIYPFYVYYSVHTYRECVYSFFCVLCIWLWLRWLRKPTTKGLLSPGLANGLTCLISFTHFPFAVLSGLAAVLVLRPERRLARMALYLGCIGLVYGLWPLRTYVHYKTFIISTPYAPFNLYFSMLIPPELRGLSYESATTATDPVMISFEKLRHHSPHKAYQLMVPEGINAVRQRPREYLTRVRKHIFKLWRFYPYPRNYEHSYRIIKWISLLSDGVLIPLGFLGLWLCRSGKFLPLLVVIHIFSLTAIHGLSFAVIRHRLPLMGWMLIFASYAIFKSATLVRERYQKWHAQENRK